MADIPGTVPSFEDLEDNVDFVEAEDQNNPNTEIEALATEVGMFGAGLTQADGIDLLEMFRKARESFVLSFNDVDTIDVSQGEVVCVNAGATQRVPRKNASGGTITFADIDTGARAQSTTYYVYAVADAAANTVTFSVSESAVAPTGVTRFALIGKFATNAVGSGEIIDTSVVSVVGEVVVNTQYKEIGTVLTGTTVTPNDDSVPQIDEGDEIVSIPYVASDINNVLEFKAQANVAYSGSTGVVTLHLHKASITDAISASQGRNAATNQPFPLPLGKRILAGTVDVETYSLRVGPDAGVTVTVNGVGGSQKMGGVMSTGLWITEYRKVYA